MFTYVIVTCHLIPCSRIHSQSLLLHSQSYFATILISQSVLLCNQSWSHSRSYFFSQSLFLHSAMQKKKKSHQSPFIWHAIAFPVVLLTVSPCLFTNPHTHAPKGGRGCLMSPFCLESQGCHLISFSYLLSCVCVFFCLVLLLFLSCHFSANGPFSWLFFQKTLIFFVKG